MKPSVYPDIFRPGNITGAGVSWPGVGADGRYHGMRGQFRDGRFVDEESRTQHRNIQYDLDPEKMEKIWVN